MRTLINCLFLLAFISLNNEVMAQSFTLSPDSELKIIGTSNIHDWESDATKMSGTAAFDVAEDGSLDITKVKVTIPVEQLKSSKGSIMDNKTYDALKSSKHPNIVYSLKDVSSISKTANGWKASTKGDLTIAGKTKTITFAVTGKQNADGSYAWTGSVPLKMTDFEVDPPKAMFGALKTADDVEITFDVIFKEN